MMLLLTQDSFENMGKMAIDHSFPFPYLYDEPQDVARAYDAACTPDFFGFNRDLELQGTSGCLGRNAGPVICAAIYLRR